MRPLQFLLPLALLAIDAPAAEAQQFGSLFRYNYLEINYVRTDIDGTPAAMHGYGLRASIESTMDVRVLARWRDLKGNGFFSEEAEAGVGFISSLNRQVDAILDLKYLHGRRKTVLQSKNKNGWGVEGGLRMLPFDMIELDLMAEYRSLFQSEFGGNGAFLLHATENIALSVRYTYFSDQQTLEAGIRFSL